MPHAACHTQQGGQPRRCCKGRILPLPRLCAVFAVALASHPRALRFAHARGLAVAGGGRYHISHIPFTDLWPSDTNSGAAAMIGKLPEHLSSPNSTRVLTPQGSGSGTPPGGAAPQHAFSTTPGQVSARRTSVAYICCK